MMQTKKAGITRAFMLSNAQHGWQSLGLALDTKSNLRTLQNLVPRGLKSSISRKKAPTKAN